MKIAIILVIIIIGYNNLSSNDTSHIDLNVVDSCFIESHINNDCDDIKCNCIIPSWEMKIFHEYGECFYHGFDMKNFHEKNIGFIIDYFSNQFDYLGGETLNGFERHKPGDEFRRNTFLFYFKMSDTSILRLSGCISYNFVKKIEDDKEALEYVLNQNHFIMNFVQDDIKKYLQSIKNIDIDNLERFNNFGWQVTKEHFYNLFPEDVKDLIKKKP